VTPEARLIKKPRGRTIAQEAKDNQRTTTQEEKAQSPTAAKEGDTDTRRKTGKAGRDPSA